MSETNQRRASSGRDFSLVFITSKTPGAEVRSAFRSKWVWVIDTEHSAPARHATIISNLLRSYIEPGKATVGVVRSRIADGLHRDAFARLKTVIGISGAELSRVVGIPSRTAARRNLFKPDESERILRVASAFQKSIEVSGSLDKARRWFTSPKRALGDKTPLEVCDTYIGTEEVCNLLGRAEHGVFS